MVPFYVAAPTSSIDSSSKSGAHIPVEERASEEITHIAGVHVAAEGVGVYAPAFDITPGQLVTAIITEAGILRPPYNVSIERLKLLGGSSGHSGL
jgi:methylthioribose-1-phosphate isomerase